MCLPLPAAGHVDNFCCFIAPGVVALAWPNDENDWNDPQVGTGSGMHMQCTPYRW